MIIDIVLHAVGYLLLAGSLAYVLSCLVAIWSHRERIGPGDACAADGEHGVSVLKPLCGAEPRLLENLRSFCGQDHPRFEILFGVRDRDDPAVSVALRLQAEFPRIEIAVIVDPRVHGVNPKISNLMNLLPHARHDRLVIADSDISVQPDYLRVVTAPLARPNVGLVTCLYRGRALGGFWSRVGVQFIDDWFRPSVRLAQCVGARRFGFGATLALTRQALARIGGLETISNTVSDDHTLGERIADAGLTTVLSSHEVVTDVVETRLFDLLNHELRWFRTIRSVRPGSYLGTALCFTLPVTGLGLLLTGAAPTALMLAVAACAARLLLFADGCRHRFAAGGVFQDAAAFLLRDTLSLALWFRAYWSGSVEWRGQRMDLDATQMPSMVVIPAPTDR